MKFTHAHTQIGAVANVCQACEVSKYMASSGASACTSCGSSQTSVVVLPYSREAFTEAVQSNFRIGMAAAAKAGCQCEVTKSEVIITSIQASAAAPGTRRLSAAAGVTVGVSILMPNQQAGNLLVQSGALSKEGINKELDKLQVERVTSVSSPSAAGLKCDASPLRYDQLPSAAAATAASPAAAVATLQKLTGRLDPPRNATAAEVAATGNASRRGSLDSFTVFVDDGASKVELPYEQVPEPVQRWFMAFHNVR